MDEFGVIGREGFGESILVLLQSVYARRWTVKPVSLASFSSCRLQNFI